MKNAIAIWNYCWDIASLPDWISEFADRGFDAISFNSKQFAKPSSKHIRAVMEVMRKRNLAATVHGSCAMGMEVAKTVIQAMGDRLYAFTMDSAIREDSRGKLHDPRRIVATLSYLQDLTAATGVWLAIEDFPLDALALEQFATDLGTVYDHPRTGILIDVGHMHMRMKNSDYFNRLSINEYFRRLPCRLVEIHLHDNDGNKDQHGHFGLGTVPFAEVAQSLKDINFDGVCTLEIAPKSHGSTPQESKTRAVQSLGLWHTLMQRDPRPNKTDSEKEP